MKKEYRICNDKWRHPVLASLAEIKEQAVILGLSPERVSIMFIHRIDCVVYETEDSFEIIAEKVRGKDD